MLFLSFQMVLQPSKNSDHYLTHGSHPCLLVAEVLGTVGVSCSCQRSKAACYFLKQKAPLCHSKHSQGRQRFFTVPTVTSSSL